MRLVEVFKESYRIFLNNWQAYSVGAVIAMVGSILIITVPPLMFGLYYMGVKGARGEKVEYKDVFKGFSYFVQSWVFIILLYLTMLAVVILPMIVFLAVFLSIIEGKGLLGIAIVIPFLCVSLFMLAMSLVGIYAVLSIVGNNQGVVEGIKNGIRLAVKNPISSILLVILISILNMILMFIPLVGWVLMHAFPPIVFSKAFLELQK